MAFLQCFSKLAHLLVRQSTLQLKPHALHLMKVLHRCNTFLLIAHQYHMTPNEALNNAITISHVN